MRFGRDFRNAQDPRWASDYIRYDYLKTLLRITCSNLPRNGDFPETTEVLEQLHTQCEVAEQRYLSELVPLSILRGQATVAQDVQKTAKQLLLFANINARAVSRILEKINRIKASGGCPKAVLEGFYFRDPKAVAEIASGASAHRQELETRRHASSEASDECMEDALQAFSATEQSVGANEESCSKRQLPHLVETAEIHEYTRGESSMPLREACDNLLQQGADVNAQENGTGRTALAWACINGDKAMVELLLAAGADPNQVDSRGWLPMEHAAYRGHLPILALLERLRPEGGSAQHMKLGELGAVAVQKPESSQAHVTRSQPNGDGRTSVWISLGNIDASRPRKAIQIDTFRHLDGLELLAEETLYWISVDTASSDSASASYTQELPILGSTINRPWLFSTDDLASTKLIWKLSCYSSTSEESKTLVGSGISLLSTLNSSASGLRRSLVRDATIPLQDPSTSTFVGTITFTYFWSTPYSPSTSPPSPLQWDFGNGVGGHRGSGKNRIDEKRLQIGENTAQSFLTAIAHGASFIEFDVQLTKDLVPVVYHDFLLSETGTDSPMHSLSFEQFEYLSQAQGPPRSTRKPRSNSDAATDSGYLEDISERMARTKFNKVQGYKANTRGTFIHEKSCTLEDLFNHVPASIGLNIEIKYPMLFEAEDWDMEPIAIKTDIFVNTILDKVFQHAAGRRVAFSSFSPEICIALSTKQKLYPVFFLSKTLAPKGELRSCCIQQAISFAKSWSLPGIVVECTPLIHCPRLIRYIKAAGLACMSFGVMNSKPELAQVQFDAGIDAVISDSVKAITQLSRKSQANGD